LCGLGLSGTAISSPPLGQGAPILAAAEPAPSVPLARRLLALQKNISIAPLDLRARVGYPTASNSHAAAPAFAAYPSEAHDMDTGKPVLRDDERIWPPALVSGEADFHSLSPAQAYARRVHREGVPMARLWESRSALLSIGLNQQGKPGLWLIQKIH
jgi:hypothetical protein